jgi:hypothetical protein
VRGHVAQRVHRVRRSRRQLLAAARRRTKGIATGASALRVSSSGVGGGPRGLGSRLGRAWRSSAPLVASVSLRRSVPPRDRG